MGEDKWHLIFHSFPLPLNSRNDIVFSLQDTPFNRPIFSPIISNLLQLIISFLFYHFSLFASVKNSKTVHKMGKDLSDEQVSSMKEAFTLFDTDGDGKIAPSELGILMRSLGGNPTQAQLKAIIAEEKLTAPFDFPRFLDLMSKHMKPEPFDRQLRDAFKVLDKDNTGFVSVADLRHILTSIGEKLEPSEFDEWIREVDVGPDGKIRYEEFIARMVAKWESLLTFVLLACFFLLGGN